MTDGIVNIRGKEIIGYPGYTVYENGDIVSARRKITRSNGIPMTINGGRIKPGVAKNGYHIVVLGRGNTKYVHHLVAAAFIGPRPNGMTVSHINGNKTDNSSENLIYEPIGDNVRRNSHKESPRGERNGHSKLTRKDVLNIRSARIFRGCFARWAKIYGVNESTIRDAFYGRTWK